jgi:CRISPR-associated protein Cmr1
METIQYKLRTKTPIWTGGIGGTMDHLQETGIIGSLRWWYEAILRGLVSDACDPTVHSCILDLDQYKKLSDKPLGERLHESGLCDACQVFGATGWKRRFRLSVSGQMEGSGPTTHQQPTGNRYKRDGRTPPSWYFKGPGQSGEFTISITPSSREFNPILITGLLKLINGYGGLAAKTQMGYGWIEFTETPEFDPDHFLKNIHISAGSPDAKLPALENMFFCELETTDHGITAVLNAKFDVRELFRESLDNTDLRHFVCGTVKGTRQGSKIFISQAVNDRMRVWGWIPHQLPVRGYTRPQVVGEIHATLSKYGKISGWREFNSPRDLKTPHISDPRKFLVSLF